MWCVLLKIASRSVYLYIILRVFCFCNSAKFTNDHLSLSQPRQTHTRPLFSLPSHYIHIIEHVKDLFKFIWLSWCHSNVCTNVRSGDEHVTGMVHSRNARSGMTTVRNVRAKETVLRHHWSLILVTIYSFTIRIINLLYRGYMLWVKCVSDRSALACSLHCPYVILAHCFHLLCCFWCVCYSEYE